MYKVLIVDDEPLIRQSLKIKIDWQAFDCEIVAEAKNGLEALGLINAQPFDLVITDMKMPIMDGVSLLKALEESHIHTNVIIISAYSDFHYTHSTIKYGVFDYILKPIDTTELAAVISKFKNDQDQRQNASSTTTPIDVDSSISNAKKAFINNFSSSIIFDRTSTLPRLLDMDMALDYDHYLCALAFSTQRPQEDLLDMIKSTNERLMDGQNFAITEFINPIYKHHVCMILGLPDNQMIHLPLIYDTLAKGLNTNSKGQVILSVGSTCNNFNQINTSFLSAVDALNYRTINSQNVTIFADNIDNIATFSSLFNPELENNFLTALGICNFEETRFNIDLLFDALKDQENITFRQVYKMCSELLFMCNRLLKTYGSSLEHIFDEDITSIDFISSTGSITELKEWFTSVINKIMKRIKLKKSTDTEAIIEDILQFLKEHYFEEITLTDLSQRYHLNLSYLSSIFKDYVGNTFVDTLTSIRLEKAEDLLLSNNYKIREITEKVGYKDQRYFSKLFKKHYGMTPKSFRKDGIPSSKKYSAISN